MQNATSTNGERRPVLSDAHLTKKWPGCSLFKDLPQQYLNILEGLMEEIHFEPGESIIIEGDVGDCLYVIEQGEVVIKKGDISLARKEAGEHFGAMAMVESEPRSASVLAETKVVVNKLRFESLQSPENGSLYALIFANLVYDKHADLRNMNDVVVKEVEAKLEESRKRVWAGEFFASLVLWLVSYQFLLGLFLEYGKVLHNKTLLNILNPTMMVLFGIAAYIRASKSEFPFSVYGLNLNNWKKNIREALVWTGIFIIVLVFFKWILTLYVPFYQGKPIIDTTRVQSYSWTTLFVIYIAYSLLVPVQEFIARGVIQTSLEKLLQSDKGKFMPIFLSNLIFSGLHIHMNFKFAIMTLIPGIMWGVLFARQKSLLGVSISHVIIGLFALIFMGLM